MCPTTPDPFFLLLLMTSMSLESSQKHFSSLVEVSTVPGMNGNVATSSHYHFPSPATHVYSTLAPFPGSSFCTVRDSEYWAEQRSLTFTTPRPESATSLHPWSIQMPLKLSRAVLRTSQVHPCLRPSGASEACQRSPGSGGASAI